MYGYVSVCVYVCHFDMFNDSLNLPMIFFIWFELIVVIVLVELF